MVAKRPKYRYDSYDVLCEDLANAIGERENNASTQSGYGISDTNVASGSNTTLSLNPETSTKSAAWDATPEEISDRERVLISRDSQAGTSIWYASFLVGVIVLCGYIVNGWINHGKLPQDAGVIREEENPEAEKPPKKKADSVDVDTQKPVGTDQSSGGFGFDVD